MSTSLRYFLFLLWICYLFVCGILLFTRGFLLSRRTLLQKSSCSENSQCSELQKLSKEQPSFENSQRYLECLDRNQLKLRENSENYCTESERRVVLLVIDALRYDFAHYNRSIKEEELLPYQNRLPIIDELLTTLPNNSQLFKFIANPPTTTMQRLKGMTTGSLPTFIDIGSNFASPEIEEDNILDQLKEQDKNVVFMGDDTWSALYPGRFKREYSYPSFNVWDLDTVDSGAIFHLKRELQRRDWSLLIAHFLGVDHCGHKFGPFHPEMTRKLNQMNQVIKDVIDTTDDDTVVIVLGDHGMTQSGDHGGESKNEITSALFIYSPVPFISGQTVTKKDTVYQIDIVPTLAAILGFAIPYSNLGKIILSALPMYQEVDEQSQQAEISYSINALSVNIEQIMVYINTYSRQTHAFSKAKLSSLLEKFHALKWKLGTVNDSESFKHFQEAAVEFLDYVRELCEEVWVQFDSISMSRGLVLTFLVLVFSFFIIEGLPSDDLNAVLDGTFLWLAYGTIAFCFVSSALLQYYKMIEDMFIFTYVSSLTISIFLMAVVVVQNWEAITMLWFNTSRNRNYYDAITRFIHLCSLLLLFSNSFIIEEGTVLLYLVNSLIWVTMHEVSYRKPQSPTPRNVIKEREKYCWLVKFLMQKKLVHFVFAMVFTMLLRWSTHHWRCREEQRWCIQLGIDAMKSALKSDRLNLTSLWTLVNMTLFVTVIRIWLRNLGNLVGFSPTVLLVRYTPSVIVVCVGGFWVLQGMPSEARLKLFLPWQLQILPVTALFLIGLNFLSAWFRPLCAYFVQKKSDLMNVYGSENILPHLLHQVKEVITHPDGSQTTRTRTPVVYGLATGLSAIFIILAEFLGLFLMMMLGSSLGSSVVLMFATLTMLLIIFAYIRLDSSLVSENMLFVPWSHALSWAITALFFFYGTGHQPTFPGIHWNAAFIGTGGQSTYNIIPAFLVGANTFCSHIAFGLLLPTLFLAPYTLPLMAPRWMIPFSNSQFEKCLKRQAHLGEITLLENIEATHYALLKLATKYILFHGSRMFAIMLSAAIHCRHLMVWKIFTPKFLFEGIGFMVTMGSVLAGFLLFVRLSTQLRGLTRGVS